MSRATLSIIGAGSTYTPVLIEAMITHFDVFPFGAIVLQDISEQRLGVISRYVIHQLQAGVGKSVEVKPVSDLRSALAEGDFVLPIYRIGGHEARRSDALQARSYGIIGQETQGWGGFLSALRNIPFAVEISSILNEINENAWLINITNPVGIITQACHTVRTSKTIGICEVPVRMVRAISKVLGHSLSDLTFSYVGLNHLSWIVGVSLHEEDLLEEVLNYHLDDLARELDWSDPPHGRDAFTQIARSIQAIPSPYLRYYYLLNEMRSEMLKSEKSRADICIGIDAELMKLYSDLDDLSWPRVAALRGGYLLGTTLAVLIDRIMRLDDGVVYPCVANSGMMDFLDDRAVIEVPVEFVGDECRVSPVPRLHHHIRGLLGQVSSYEYLTASAGISGDRDQALAALASHPLMPDVNISKKMFSEALSDNSEYMNQFDP